MESDSEGEEIDKDILKDMVHLPQEMIDSMGHNIGILELAAEKQDGDSDMKPEETVSDKKGGNNGVRDKDTDKGEQKRKK